MVRYVHLNPLRAGLVSDLTALDGYRYCGHAVLMGNRAYEVQAVDEVLGRFGSRGGQARLAYRDFVAAGVCEGESPRFRGGGLVRSAGGWRTLKGRKPEERELADQRVLGSGAFVTSLLEKEEQRPIVPRTTKDAVLAEVAAQHGVPAA